jgi:hypothetical protein
MEEKAGEVRRLNNKVTKGRDGEKNTPQMTRREKLFDWQFEVGALEYGVI